MPASSKEVCPGCGKAIRHRTMTAEECGDRQMSEAKLYGRVVYRAKKAGWRYTHAGRGIVPTKDGGMVVTNMAKGWPDLFLLNPDHDPPCLAIELKTEVGEVEAEQLEWLQLLNRCGIPAVVVRPSDLRKGAVDAILK